MKKMNLLISASLLVSGLVAQNNVQILVGPDVQVEYQVVNMSANGRWACGNVNDGDGRGFVWDLVNDKITMLAPIGQFAPVLDVSNDGTLVGTFISNEATANGASVEVGGYYKDGKWHYLPGCGIANGISDNGQYIAGISVTDGYRMATWTLDGTMTLWDNYSHRSGDYGSGGYDVNNDGTMVCGYGGHPVKKNRTPALWVINEETGTRDSVLMDYANVGPFAVAWNFSPDGTKVSADKVVYDVTTRTAKRIDLTGVYDVKTGEKKDFLYGYEFFRITNNGNIVGHYTTGMQDYQHAAYVVDGKIYDLADYLEVNYGANLEGWTLLECTGISEDEKMFAVNAYDTSAIPHPLIINLNANLTNPAPTSLNVTHLEGTDVCRITWEAPLANVEGVKAYKVWRNDAVVAELSKGEYTYYDRNLANDTYEYAISAVYEADESAKCASATVSVTDFAFKAPRSVSAIMAGISDVRLSWNAPLANRPALKYGSPKQDVASFGGGEYSFEQAVRFEAADLAVYGKQITDISFYPMSRQNSWTVNFYTAKDTALFATETLDASNLTYGVENTVRLKNPVTVPAGEDIYVGIFVDVTGYGGYTILGAIFNTCRAGYTDLLRRQGEPRFMSLYENAITDPNGAYEYPLTFPIGICFGDAASLENNNVASYKVYTDGAEVQTTERLNARLKSVAEGEHTFGVAAVYSNGTETLPATVSMNVTKNTAAYKGITDPVLTVSDDLTLTATWETPVEDDETFITYAGDTNARTMAPGEAEGYSCLLAAVYDNDNLGDYTDYLITDLKFFPTGDADFLLILEENGKAVAEVEIFRGEGYTKGMWNTFKLDEPVVVKAGAEYKFIIDVWQVTPGEAPVGMDDLPAFENESDLYSSDNGATYTSISTTQSSDGNGNWMMGLVIRSAEIQPLPVVGYEVYVDRKAVSETPQTATTFSQKLEEGTHNFRVDVVYEGFGSVKGSTKFITLSTGVDGAELAPVVIESTDTEITVLGGDVTSVSVYSTTGTLMAQAGGATLNIANIESGVYILTAVVDGKELTRKITVK